MKMVSDKSVGLSLWLGLPVEQEKSREEKKEEKKEKMRVRRRESDASAFPASSYSVDDVVNEIRRVSSRFQRLSAKCEEESRRSSGSQDSSRSSMRPLMPAMNV